MPGPSGPGYRSSFPSQLKLTEGEAAGPLLEEAAPTDGPTIFKSGLKLLYLSISTIVFYSVYSGMLDMCACGLESQLQSLL